MAELDSSVIYGDETITGRLTVLGNIYAKKGMIIDGNTDDWLRINESKLYSTGVYFGTNQVRTDGTFTVGNDGATFYVGSSKMTYVGGNVGIGTTAPSYSLDVQSSVANIQIKSTTGTNPALLRVSNTGGNLYVGKNDSVGTGILSSGGLSYSSVINSAGTNALQLAVNDSAIMTVLNGGNVGIGTNTPGAKLEVSTPALTFDTATPGLTKGSIHINPIGSNDNFAAITFGANNVSSLVNSAQAGIYVQGSGSYGTKMYFAVTNNYVTGATTAMTIVNNGNIGIGPLAPSYALDIQRASAAIRIKSTTGTNNATLILNNTGGDFYVGRNDSVGTSLVTADGLAYAAVLNAQGGNPMQFAVNNAVAMTVLNGGNVGIGVTNPLDKLHVNGNMRFSANQKLTAMHSNGTALMKVLTLNDNIVIGEPEGNTWSGTTIHGGNGGITLSSSAGNSSPILFGSTAGTTFTERMRITHDGKVGIGMSPSVPLQVNAATEQVRISRNATEYLSISVVDTTTTLSHVENTGDADNGHGKMIFSTNASKTVGIANGGFRFQHNDGTEYMRIRMDGNVGIGTTTPGAKLTVAGIIQSEHDAGYNGTIKLGGSASANQYATIDFSTLSDNTLTLTTFYTGVNNAIVLKPANTEILRATKNYIGVGTAAPSFKLDVAGDMRVQGTNIMRFGGVGASDAKYSIGYNSTENSLDICYLS